MCSLVFWCTDYTVWSTGVDSARLMLRADDGRAVAQLTCLAGGSGSCLFLKHFYFLRLTRAPLREYRKSNQSSREREALLSPPGDGTNSLIKLNKS